MDSASVLPPTRRSFGCAVKALWWHLSALVTGAGQASVGRKAVEPSRSMDVIDAVDTSNRNPTGRHSRHDDKYPPRRAAFLEEAAMAREMFRL